MNRLRRMNNDRCDGICAYRTQDSLIKRGFILSARFSFIQGKCKVWIRREGFILHKCISQNFKKYFNYSQTDIKIHYYYYITALQAETVAVSFPDEVTGNFIDLILPAVLWTWNRPSLWKKLEPGVSPGGKGGRYIGPITLSPSGADCHSS
jgi:hypothetical protein